MPRFVLFWPAHLHELISPAGFDALGDLLKPTVPTHSAPPPPQMAIHPGGKLLANDLDSSLANLVGSEFGETRMCQQREIHSFPARVEHLHNTLPGL